MARSLSEWLQTGVVFHSVAFGDFEGLLNKQLTSHPIATTTRTTIAKFPAICEYITAYACASITIYLLHLHQCQPGIGLHDKAKLLSPAGGDLVVVILNRGQGLPCCP